MLVALRVRSVVYEAPLAVGYMTVLDVKSQDLGILSVLEIARRISYLRLTGRASTLRSQCIRGRNVRVIVGSHTRALSYCCPPSI